MFTTLFSNTLKKVVVVASVALVVPVLGASTAYADGGDGHGKALGKAIGHAAAGSAAADAAGDAAAPAAPHHGKGSETDKSGSSSNLDGTFQGASTSTPDQDGTGMDRGADNNDKTGPGTDGNNGCGNEPRLAAPRDGGRPTDDDNNGWCGSKPKPEPQAPVTVDTRPEVTPVVVDVPKTDVVTTPAAPVVTAPVAVPVQAAPAAAPAAAPQVVVAQGTVTPLVGTPVTQAARAAGFVGPVAPTQGAVVAAGAVAPAALPFTGAPVGLLLLVAGLVVGVGAALVRTGARRTA